MVLVGVSECIYSGYVDQYDSACNIRFTQCCLGQFDSFCKLLDAAVTYIKDCESDNASIKLDSFESELLEHYTNFKSQLKRGGYSMYQDTSTYITDSGLEYTITIIINPT